MNTLLLTPYLNIGAFVLGAGLLILGAFISLKEGRTLTEKFLRFLVFFLLPASLLLLFAKISDVTLPNLGLLEREGGVAGENAKKIAEVKAAAESASQALEGLVSQSKDVERLSKEVSEKNQAAGEKLKEISATLENASREFQKLKTVSEINMTLIAAQNDDRKAFERLKVIAAEKDNPFAPRAGEVERFLLEKHHRVLPDSDFEITWAPGIDPMKLSLGQLKRIYKTSPTYLKPALVRYIWDRTDFIYKERMAFLAEILKDDDSLLATEFAGRYFVEASGVPVKALETDKLLVWWEENKTNLIPKPKAESKPKVVDKKKKKK